MTSIDGQPSNCFLIPEDNLLQTPDVRAGTPYMLFSLG